MKPIEDPRQFRDAMGAYTTGVTIITSTNSSDEPVGFTANSFSSVSLDPPLVLFSLDKQAQCLPAFLASSSFAVNVLHEDQRALSDHFARSTGDKWAEVPYETWVTGCPILANSIASFECEYRYNYDGGDHVIFVGEVLRMERRDLDRPLLYFQGSYRTIAS